MMTVIGLIFMGITLTGTTITNKSFSFYYFSQGNLYEPIPPQIDSPVCYFCQKITKSYIYMMICDCGKNPSHVDSLNTFIDKTKCGENSDFFRSCLALI